MQLTTLYACAALMLQLASASPARSPKHNTLARRKDASFSLRQGVKFADATTLKQADTILSLKSAGGAAVGSTVLRNALVNGSASTTINAAEQGAGYAITIDFGGETFSVILDTGSSDLWLAQEGLQCVDAYMDEVDVSDCAFGPLFDSDYEQIPDENFNITYGDGEFLSGILACETVCIGGIAVVDQEVALVRYAYWEGDNETSGLIGFAYPSITSAYQGTDPTKNNANKTSVPYTNWVFNAIGQGLIGSSFSIAISRGVNSGPSGQLGLGGLPNVDYVDEWATSPLQILELTPHDVEQKQYSYYTIIPDGFILRSNKNSKSHFYAWEPETHASPGGSNTTADIPVIIDSGTTLIYLPLQLAIKINAAFSPAAEFNSHQGIYEAECDAIPPYLSVVIGGKEFPIDAQDLLLTNLGQDSLTGLCITGVQPITGIYILGDSFMKNVVSVFDIGSSEMRFAARVAY